MSQQTVKDYIQEFNYKSSICRDEKDVLYNYYNFDKIHENIKSNARDSWCVRVYTGT